ncbi:HAD family hydrolase [Natronosporangium hydrolyticum]|uniref:HAD family hydrolase n=1 Tax=Natronosporangium hydrolyticum TaxID=2811111 RepID=A0A895YKU3_9ACTN|nr:HAD family hydrolase [Natronosporangium hydrolyticum]QSB14720.1 HAD family hydrolase [Natronosporangium hydrolyticum]
MPDEDRIVIDMRVVLHDAARMVKGLLLDFYGTVVEEDDRVVAAICHDVAASTAVQVTPAQVGTAWWRAFQAAMAASDFRSQREIAVASLAEVAMTLECRGDPAGWCERQFAYWRRPPMRAGSRAFLEATDLPICIVSNIDRDDLEAALEYHGLAFTAVVTSDDVRVYKPAPAMFQQALAALGLDGDHVVHVGDSLTADVAGAHAAGLAAIWVNRRGREAPPWLAARHIVESLTELGPMLSVHGQPRPLPEVR